MTGVGAPTDGPPAASASACACVVVAAAAAVDGSLVDGFQVQRGERDRERDGRKKEGRKESAKSVFHCENCVPSLQSNEDEIRVSEMSLLQAATMCMLPAASAEGERTVTVVPS